MKTVMKMIFERILLDTRGTASDRLRTLARNAFPQSNLGVGTGAVAGRRMGEPPDVGLQILGIRNQEKGIAHFHARHERFGENERQSTFACIA